MIDFAGVEALTFDCYGTLIDWEAGLRVALVRALGANAARVADEALLTLYGALEARGERGHGAAFRSYREVQRSVMADMAARFGVPVREPDALSDSIAEWPAFADSPAALAALAGRFQLCVVSNIDDDLFAHSRRRLVAGGGWDFAEVVTAQQVRSYKPRRAHFKEALRRLGLPVPAVVHVAQSLYHDIAPAGGMGFRTVWVSRQGGRAGATPAADARPDLEVRDLTTLARVAGVA